ncbi:MAG TPA: HU family DNA-binding protein [Dysgonamonadaceae bacterium]|nr:HU family DNA-binding protein [Dysgonamonadaceae bacterium]
MSSKLNMQDIIDLLVAKSDISKEEAEKFIVELFNLIEKGLSTDELIKIKDLGTFRLTPIQERESVDVNTKEKILIPAHKRISFIPASLLKTTVNKPFAHFETTPLNDGIFEEGIPEADSIEKESDEEVSDDYEDKTNKAEHTEVEAGKINLIAAAAEEASREKDELLMSTTPSTTVVEDEQSTYSEEDKTEVETETEKAEEQEKSLEQEVVVIAPLETPTTYVSKPKKNAKRYILISTVIALLLLFTGAFAYYYYFSNNSIERVSEMIQTSKSEESKSTATAETLLKENQNNTDPTEIINTQPRKTAKMSPGRTLRLIALDKLGDKEFWIYIYIINKEKIENPNVIPIGLVLELPHHNEYPMDANNTEDIAKAKKLGDETLKSFGN